MQYEPIRSGQFIIIKSGTGILFGEDDVPKPTIWSMLSYQFRILWNRDIKVAPVSSGAIAAGRHHERRFGRDPNRLSKPVLAGIGAMSLLELWNTVASDLGSSVCQTLVTYSGLLDPEKQRRIRLTIYECLEKGILPVINENDPVSDAEIVLKDKGESDNDLLTAKLAPVIEPNGVLFLSEVGGLYDKDPRKFSDARMFSEVDAQNIPDCLLTHSDPSPNGTGGVPTKIRAAIECTRFGPVAIAGALPTVAVDFIKGRPVGTRIGSRNMFG